MRIKNSVKNISVTILSQIIIAILGFVSRKVFLDSLGIEYLGINGLLTNVLAMLSLVEGGIGTSIIYHLYKPLAEDDRPKIIALVQLYKKAYMVLALIILVLSVALFPFLGLFMNGGSVSSLSIIYFIFVAKNMVSYFNAHKISLMNADQKEYVLASINFWFQLLTMAARIVVLLWTKDYVLYLLIEIFIYIIQILFNARIVDKRYSYINTKEKYFLEKEEKDSLIRNVKALFLHNIGSYCVFGTDNILISTIFGIVTVGLYSNYTMIIGQLNSLILPLLNGMGASVGNLIAKESTEKSYAVFNVMYLMNFWVYSVCVIFLYNMLEPFISWWLGKGFLLDPLTFIIILVNFYLTGLRASVLIFKSKSGLFVQDKYVPLLEAAINLGSALVFVKYMGLAGIFLGTTLSTLAIVSWNVPRLVFKLLFKLPLWFYFKKYLFFAFLTLVTGWITTLMSNFLVKESGDLVSLIIKGIVCLSIPNLIYLALFYKRAEFTYIVNSLKQLLLKSKTKVQVTSSS